MARCSKWVGVELRQRNSKYWQASEARVCSACESRLFRSLELLTRGSQWSAKVTDTRREPVRKLLIRQNTIVFVNAGPGIALVKATGSYPYVARSACSHAVV